MCTCGATNQKQSCTARNSVAFCRHFVDQAAYLQVSGSNIIVGLSLEVILKLEKKSQHGLCDKLVPTFGKHKLTMLLEAGAESC